MNDFMEEIQESLKQIRLQQDAKLDSLMSTITQIKEQNDDIRLSVDFMSTKYEEVRVRLEEMESERRNNLNYIKVLEQRIETLERGSRSTSIELRNIPHTQSETKENLIQIIKEVGLATNAPIQTADIKDIFRVKSGSSIKKPIIAEFTSVLTKEKLLNSIKVFKKQYREITTSTIKIKGTAQPIYISENLTPKAKRLFYLARDYAKNKNYKFCWVSHGVVYLRKTEGSSALRIINETDFEKLETQK